MDGPSKVDDPSESERFWVKVDGPLTKSGRSRGKVDFPGVKWAVSNIEWFVGEV